MSSPCVPTMLTSVPPTTQTAAPPTTLTPPWLDDLNEQILEANRAAAMMFLDAYETTVESIVGYQEQAARQTGVDWFAAAAQFARELAKRQIAAGRELVK